MSKEMVAIVRVRGDINVSGDISDTMKMLNLFNKNTCSVHEMTPSIRGMLRKCKDYVTWGIIDESTLSELIKARAEVSPKDETKTKKYFRLNSPKKGYGRKGVKVSFSSGGALGDRKDKINDLIKRML